MTIEDSNDAQIKVCGIENYSSCDAHGGDVGDESELEGADAEDGQDSDVPRKKTQIKVTMWSLMYQSAESCRPMLVQEELHRSRRKRKF